MASLSLVFDLLARDNASRTFRDVGDSAERAGRQGEGFGSSIGKAMKVAGGAIAAAGLGTMFVGFIKDAAESAKIGRMTEAVLKSTGGAAKITADQVGALATSISNKTAVDDEAIQSASNLLLTFTRVRNETGKGNDVFNQATQAAIDMSAAMGTDANAAALQLGKALNDPVKGMTALTRSGVSFTQQQKDQVKAMVAAGDTLGAQKLILKELQVQFGGAAAAAADPMERLKVVAGNLGEEIGGAVLPMVEKFATFTTDRLVPGLRRVGDVVGGTVGWFRDLWSAVSENETFRSVIDWVRDNATPILAGLGGALTVVAAPAVIGALGTLATVVGGALVGAFAALLSPLGLVALAVGGIAGIFVAAYRESEPLRAAVNKLQGAFDVFLGVFRDANNAGGIQGFFDGIRAGIEAAWPMVKMALSQMGSALWEWIRENIAPTLVALGEWLSAAIDWIWNTGLPRLVDAASRLGSALWAWVQPMIVPTLQKLGEWLLAFEGWVLTQAWPAIIGFWVRAGAAMVQWIVDRIPGTLKNLGEWLGSLTSWLWNTGLPQLGATMAALGQQIVAWVQPRIPEILGNIAEFMGRVIGWIVGTGIPLLIGAMLKLSYELVTWVMPRLPDLLLNLLQFMAGAVRWVLTSGLPMLFDALWQMGTGAVRGIWESMQASPLFQKLGEIFNGAVEIVRGVWNRITDVFKAPIRIVFDFVNSRMIGPINSLLGVFPGNLKIPALPGFKDGGHTGPGAKDQVAGLVHADEFVFTKEQTRRLGVNRLEAIANGANLSVGDIGGPLDFVGDGLGWVGDKLADAAGWVADMAVKGARAVAGAVLNPLRDAAKGLTPNNVVGNVLDGSIDRLVNAVLGKSDEYDSAAKAAFGAAGAGGGSFAAGGGAVGGGWQSIWDFVKARIPQARINSTYRAGDPGYHGRGKAIDFGFGTGPGGPGSPGLASIKRLLHDSLGGNLAELIYNGVGNDRNNLKNGKPLAYSAATQAAHRNHVHAAVYDQGGLLPPGFTMAFNGTGKSERIRTAEQEAALWSDRPLDLSDRTIDRLAAAMVRGASAAVGAYGERAAMTSRSWA